MEAAEAPPNSQIVAVPTPEKPRVESPQDSKVVSPTQVRELVQVIEAAESAIRNQMQENEHLRLSLKVSEWELQNRRMEGHNGMGAPNGMGAYDGRMPPLPVPGRNAFRAGNLLMKRLQLPHSLSAEEQAINRLQEDMDSSLVLRSGGPSDSDNERNATQGLPNGTNGHARGTSNGTAGPGYGPPHLDTSSAAPSSASMSPHGTHHPVSGLDMRYYGGGVSRSSDTTYHTADVYLRTARMYEEENSQLRSRLVDASMKEAQLMSEKRILERRVSELRLAYDQQQQGLVDAASKALSYRQDVIEENIRLTYSLQSAERDRSVYLTSLLPVLAEFDLQPPVTDAHSIVSAVKVLVQHLRSEYSLNESDPLYQQPSGAFPPASQLRQTPYQSSPGTGHGMELVAQPPSLPSQLVLSPSTQPQRSAPWDSPRIPYPNTGVENASHENPRHVHYIGQDHAGASESPPVRLSSPAVVSSADHLDNDHLEEQDQDGFGDRDLYDPPYPLADKDDQDRPEARLLLPPVVEEPNASASEDDDPLPAIDGLSIFGSAVLGGKLTACGHSINGTSLCIFQWVRHHKNGTAAYIEGAAQPEYTVTADDCDCMVAIECVPMDERNRRGDLVTVSANEGNWITCDAEMQDQLDGYFTSGVASFELQLLLEGSVDDTWEQAQITIKRSHFELRKVASRRVVVSDKFATAVSMRIPVGNLKHCVLATASGRQWNLDLPDSRTRDTLVLAFRYFLKAATEGKRGRRKVPWLGIGRMAN